MDAPVSWSTTTLVLRSMRIGWSLEGYAQSYLAGDGKVWALATNHLRKSPDQNPSYRMRGYSLDECNAKPVRNQGKKPTFLLRLEPINQNKPNKAQYSLGYREETSTTYRYHNSKKRSSQNTMQDSWIRWVKRVKHWKWRKKPLVRRQGLKSGHPRNGETKSIQ